MSFPNDPAFPTSLQHDNRKSEYDGLTVREYFAVKIMTGLLASWRENKPCFPDAVADDAVKYADALIRRLKS